MNTPHSERHILDRVRAGELTTADLKVADWQDKHPEQTIPAWFRALDRDLRADLIKVGWVAEVKTTFPLSEKAIFLMLCGYATTIQALRDEVACLRAALVPLVAKWRDDWYYYERGDVVCFHCAGRDGKHDDDCAYAVAVKLLEDGNA